MRSHSNAPRQLDPYTMGPGRMQVTNYSIARQAAGGTDGMATMLLLFERDIALRRAYGLTCRAERRITDFFKSAKAGAVPGKVGLQSVRCQLCRVLMPVEMGAVCYNCKPKVGKKC